MFDNPKFAEASSGVPWDLGDSAFAQGMFQINQVRMGKVYRRDLADAPNLRVLLNTTVVRIGLREGGGAVAQVDARCLNGSGFAVRARRYVLAGGAIENPRLLLVSDDVQAKGIGNDHDLVGRFFMEHPHLFREAVVVGSPGYTSERYYATHTSPSGMGKVRGMMRLKRRVVEEEKILNIAVVPWKYSSRKWQKLPLAKALGKTLRDTDQGAAEDVHMVHINTASEQAPNPDSRVLLDTTKDALGVRRIKLDWRLLPIDKRTVRRAHQLVGLELARGRLGRLKSGLTDHATRWPSRLDGGNHHIGTTRIHPDPSKGVVDADCKVHGVDDLFVAGSSVFPTSGAANPTYTIVALALRLADHLSAELRP